MPIILSILYNILKFDYGVMINRMNQHIRGINMSVPILIYLQSNKIQCKHHVSQTGT